MVNPSHRNMIGIIAISLMVMANNANAASANYRSSKEGVIKIPSPPTKQAINPLINLKNYMLSAFSLSLLDNEQLAKFQDMAYFFWKQQNGAFREASHTTRFVKKSPSTTYQTHPHKK